MVYLKGVKKMKTLLVVDVQNDFVDGSLAVPDAIKIIPFINSIADKYDLIISTLDWHPSDHEAFACNHKNKKVFDVINLHGIEQILWVAHCVENTIGVASHKDLNIKVNKYILKGTNKKYHPYGAFLDGDGTETELNKFLSESNVKEIDVVGLATDFCVKATVIDGLLFDYNVNVLTEGVRGVNINPNDSELALKEMENAGADII